MITVYGRGGIDNVIRRSAGNGFHDQLDREPTLKQGRVVVAREVRGNKGMFKNVVFVIDHPKGPLSDIVYNGLVGASEEGFAIVTLPAIRMGVMLGVIEKSLVEAVEETAKGVARFIEDFGNVTSITDITFVLYNDENTAGLLDTKLHKFLSAEEKQTTKMDIVSDVIRLLEEEIQQLENWANESLSGGWSTHQVQPMRKRAQFLRGKVTELKRYG
jgi:hypothetical protein